MSKWDNKTIDEFQPSSYSGEWWEIGKYPTLIYEKDCGHAKAIYTWNALTQRMKVENQCLNDDNELIRKRFAEAWIEDPTEPGKLSIQFIGLPRDIGTGSYWILWTDYDNYSIVGSPDKKYLWILARTPTIPLEDTIHLKKVVEKFGYDPKILMINTNTVLM